MNDKILQLACGNKLYGDLSKGCKLCMAGGKLPIYVTSLCDKDCYYCPLIPQYRNKDVMLMAGQRIDNIDIIVKYAKKFPGMSISGGEPLLRFNRVLNIITRVKEKYGKKFHIHMYTHGDYITSEIIEKLINAGLDEIRIHNFDIEIFKRIINFDIILGAEIPCAPKETTKFIKFIRDLDKMGVSFINVDEMQSSKLALPKFRKMGYKVENQRIVGSRETGENIVTKVCKEKLNISVHYCSIETEVSNAKKRKGKLGV